MSKYVQRERDFKYEMITNYVEDEDDDEKEEKILCRFCKDFVRIWEEGNQCDICGLIYCCYCQKRWVDTLNSLDYGVEIETFLYIEEDDLDFCPFCVKYTKNEEEPQLLSDILQLDESDFKINRNA
jgi:hypothetical protein